METARYTNRYQYPADQFTAAGLSKKEGIKRITLFNELREFRNSLPPTWRSGGVRKACRDYLKSHHPEWHQLLVSELGNNMGIKTVHTFLFPAPTCPECGKPSSPMSPWCTRECFNEHHHGVRHLGQREDVKAKSRQTMLANHGVEHALQSAKIRRKYRKTVHSRLGVDNPSQSEAIKAKKVATTLKNFGVLHHTHDPGVQAKTQQTNLENFGVTNPMKSPEISSKTDKTNQARYGARRASSLPEYQDKASKTYEERTGYDHPMRNPDTLGKMRENCLALRGVEHPSQDPEVSAKQKRNAYALKTVLIEGRVFEYQGWEDFVIRKAIRRFGISRVFTQFDPEYNSTLAKKIRWIPDLWVANKGFIEAKSDYTFGSSDPTLLAANVEKAKRASELGVRLLWCVVLNQKSGKSVTLEPDWWRRPKTTAKLVTSITKAEKLRVRELRKKGAPLK